METYGGCGANLIFAAGFTLKGHAYEADLSCFISWGFCF